MRNASPLAAQRAWTSHGAPLEERLAVEEPLEIRVSGETVALTMRTPGQDRDLALGFLFGEGLLRSLDDVSGVAPCGRPDQDGYGNAIEVTPAPGAQAVLQRLDLIRRGGLTTAACGVCGRKRIDDLLALCGEVAPGPQVALDLVTQAPHLLRGQQPVFEATGGVHGAAVLDASGRLMAAAEDIGRHNAVDKVLGALLRTGAIPASRGDGAPAMLVVSGRASFEIVQKAAVAKLGLVVGVSAASSLAVTLAQRTGLTLIGFCRPPKFTVYSHPGRIRGASFPSD